MFVRRSLRHPKISIHATTYLTTEMISSCHKDVRIVLVANVNKCAYWSLTCCTAGHSNTKCISSPISFIVQCSKIILICGILGLACRPLSTGRMWHDVLNLRKLLILPASRWACRTRRLRMRGSGDVIQLL
jgi:hypothetical protein